MAQLVRFASSGALALALIFANTAPAAAAHSSISGTVTTTSGRAISGVCVKLGQRENAPCWTYTNAYGQYRIDLPDAPDGITWTLRFVHPKYRTVLTAPIYVDGPTTYDQKLVRR